MSEAIAKILDLTVVLALLASADEAIEYATVLLRRELSLMAQSVSVVIHQSGRIGGKRTLRGHRKSEIRAGLRRILAISFTS
jgi:hypothetical protein